MCDSYRNVRSAPADYLSNIVRFSSAKHNRTLSDDMGHYLSLRYIEMQTIPDKIR